MAPTSGPNVTWTGKFHAPKICGKDETAGEIILQLDTNKNHQAENKSSVLLKPKLKKRVL